jgi:hypothetical protein
MKKIRAMSLPGLLAIALVLAGVSAPAPLSAQELTRTLTAAQVACNAGQLEKLLNRSYLTPIRGGLLHSLYVTYNEYSFYEGLGIARESDRFPTATETYLAFHMNPDVRPHLLNPERPPIGQVSLTREDSGSQLTTPLTYEAMVLQVNPLLNPGPPPWTDPGRLQINNLEQNPAYTYRVADVKPGRGLEQDGLLDPCHLRFTGFDRWVFSLLQRMLVITANTWLGGNTFVDYPIKAAIFRGEDPHVFRIDIYPTNALVTGNRLAVRLRIDWTPDGKLTTGFIEGLPFCTGPGQQGCTTSIQPEEVRVFLGKPVFNARRPFPLQGFGYNRALGNPDPTAAKSDIDFAQLLEGTAWNAGGFAPPAEP